MDNRHDRTQLVTVLPILMLACLCATPTALAQRFQWPDKPENLQVLPDTVGGRQLGQIMRAFTGALGVRCEHCHVGEPGQSLNEFDFVSDAKEAKKKARVMMKMVRAINADYLTGLSEFEAADHSRVLVTCTTCHRGRTRPEMLEDIVSETALSSGVDSAITQYQQLRDDYYGGFSFDFREGTLTDVAERLQRAGDAAGALRMMALELEVSGESPRSLASLAELQSQAGMKAAAIISLERAIEIAPENMKPFLTRQLEALNE